jgi:hypothetical protein
MATRPIGSAQHAREYAWRWGFPAIMAGVVFGLTFAAFSSINLAKQYRIAIFVGAPALAALATACFARRMTPKAPAALQPEHVIEPEPTIDWPPSMPPAAKAELEITSRVALPTEIRDDRELTLWLARIMANPLVLVPNPFQASPFYRDEELQLLHQSITRYLVSARNDLQPAHWKMVGCLVFSEDFDEPQMLDVIKRCKGNLEILEITAQEGIPLGISLESLRTLCPKLWSITINNAAGTDLEWVEGQLAQWPGLHQLVLTNVPMTNDEWNTYLMDQLPKLQRVGRPPEMIARNIVISQKPVGLLDADADSTPPAAAS